MMAFRGHHCFVLQVVWSALAVGEKWKVTIPTQVSAFTGSCVVIPCYFTHPSSHKPHDVLWYQYSKIPLRYPLVYSRTRPQEVIEQFRGRTEVMGNAAGGNCTLKINDISALDNGQTIYPWIDKTNLYQTVTLVVTETAARPEMSVSGEQVEGSHVRVSCEVIHSCPAHPPSLSFGKQGGEAEVNDTDEGDGRWRLRSVFTFTAKAEDHGRAVGCEVIHPGGQSANEELVLNVSYSPRSVDIREDLTVVQVGADMSLACTSDANPPASSFLWYSMKDGLSTALNHTTKTITVSRLNPDENIFHCTAVNALGRANSSAAYEIIAEYEPTILPESSCSYHTGHMVCRCLVKAHPSAAVFWEVNGQQQASTSTVDSLLNHVVEDTWSTTGATQDLSVTCMVSNTHGQQKSLLKVFVKGRPTNVTISQSPVRPMVGETVTLSCLGQGYPPLSSFRWFQMQGQHVIQRSENTEHLCLMELTRDIGSFRCLAGNDMGEANSSVTAVNVEYAPIILPSSSCSLVNDIIRCECVVDSHPLGSINWTPLNTHANGSLNITVQKNWRRIRTSILISPDNDNVNNILCNSTNEHGSAFVQLYSRGETSSQSTIYGGVGIALVLLFASVLVFVWKFHTDKKSANINRTMDELETERAWVLQVNLHASTDHEGVPDSSVN